MRSQPHPATHGKPSASLDFGPFHATDATYEASLHVPRHAHLRPGFTLTLMGSYTETFRRQEEIARAGSVLVKPAHALHSNRYGSSGCRCFLIGIDLEYLASQRQLAKAVKTITLHTSGAVSDIMRRMYGEFRSGETACALILEGLGLELAAMVLRSAERSAAARRPPPWLRAIREQLDAAIRGPTPRFSALATSAGIHPVHLSRAFRAAYGCAPGYYLRRLRIEHARRLLRDSEMTLSQVAQTIGYYDQSHFTTVFRRVTGTTPARYRARHTASRSVQSFPSYV